MRHRLAITCLLGLFGCTAAREPLQPYTLPPYTLSSSEMNAVVHGIWSAARDLDEPNFRNFKAVTGSPGEVYVCGWVNSKNSKGNRTADQAFVGTLSAGQFSPTRIGKDEYSTAEILAECREHGISI